MRKRRAIALLRISTKEQDNARQRTHIEWLKKHFGLEIVEIIELDGVSGRKVLQDRRFLQILDDLRHRPDIDGLAISAIDRFFRTDRYDDTRCFQPLADAHKLIWSKVEGEVDPSTAEGFSICMTAALKSGAEWRTLRDRTMEGKEELRAEGKHVNGPTSLPRGVAYDKATGYSYQEPDCSRVVRMFQLFLDGWSLHKIAAEVGGDWKYQAVGYTLRNRIWAFGERVYPANSWRQKERVVKVIDQPLISPDIWQAVNDRLASGVKHRRQTRRPVRSLLGGLVRCQCGKACYLRPRSRSSGHDTYLCSSRHRGGKGCGMRRVWREKVDEAVIRMFKDKFRNPWLGYILTEAFERCRRTAPARNQHAAQTRSRLEAKRERIVQMREDGNITREQCNERMAVVDRELAALRIEAPAEPPQVDAAKLAAGVQQHFLGFDKWSLERQQKVLRSAVADITMNGNEIASMTLKGEFLVQAAAIKELYAKRYKGHWRPSINLRRRILAEVEENAATEETFDPDNGVKVGSHCRIVG